MARIEVSPDGASIENARLPFKEQIAFFRQKLGRLIPTRRWDDIQKSAHDKGFMVAGAMKADLLADLAQAVDQAVAEGKSIGWFRENFFEVVAKHGWTDYTGAGTKKGRAWRTRVIYQTNLLTSYSAGRLAQLKEAGYRYWIYHHDDSVRHPRPLHQAWDGLTLPADHDFWKTHYPPNGWGCQCYLSGARSERGARRLGGDPDKKIDPEWLKTDPKTGAPVGIDKGWDYMPGATVVDTVRALAGKTVQWEYQIAKAYMDAIPQSARDLLAQAQRRLPGTADAARIFAENVLGSRGGAPIEGVTPPSYQTLGLLTRAEAEQVARLTGVERVARELYDWALDASVIRHIHKKHGDPNRERKRGQIAVEPQDYAVLLEILQAPDKIKDASEGARRAVRMQKTIAGVRYTAVFEVRTKRRMLVLQTMWKRPAPGAERP